MISVMLKLTPITLTPMPPCSPQLRELTKQIQMAGTVAALADLLRQRGSGSLNVIHLTAMLVRLAKLSADLPARSSSRGGFGSGSLSRAAEDDDASLSGDVSGNGSGDEEGGKSSSQRVDYSVTGWPGGQGEARNRDTLRRPTAVSALVSELLRAAQPLILEFDSQGVCNILHSLAKMRQLDTASAAKRAGGHGHGGRRSIRPAGTRAPPPLLPPMYEGSLLSAICDDLLYVSAQLLDSSTPQAFSTLAYAAAVLGLRPQRQWLAAFCRHSLQLLPSFSPQSLTNTMWAFATMVSKIWVEGSSECLCSWICINSHVGLDVELKRGRDGSMDDGVKLGRGALRGGRIW